MNLESVTQLGRVEIEKQITKDLTVKLRTLNAIEYATIMKAAGDTGPQDTPNLGTLGHLAELQIATLAFATVSMNGQTGSSEEFRKIYQNMQYPLLLEVYNAYTEVLNNQSSVLETLKKNLTIPS